jgi:PAT family beta-lactamase induction signal transducer AmpG
MGATIAMENFAGGMGTAAFVTLLIGLCNPRFSATQFALLTAIMALGPIVIGPMTGFLQEAVGWQSFYLLSATAAIPGIVILLILGPRINEATRKEEINDEAGTNPL